MNGYENLTEFTPEQLEAQEEMKETGAPEIAELTSADWEQKAEEEFSKYGETAKYSEYKANAAKAVSFGRSAEAAQKSYEREAKYQEKRAERIIRNSPSSSSLNDAVSKMERYADRAVKTDMKKYR